MTIWMIRFRNGHIEFLTVRGSFESFSTQATTFFLERFIYNNYGTLK